MRAKSDAALAEGLAAHRAGQLERAESIYRRIVESDPGYSDAWNLWGVIALQQTNAATALARIDRAIALNSRISFYHNNRGSALRALQRPAEAIVAFERALTLDPAHFDALANLGHVFQETGDPPRSIAAYRRALELRPNDATIANNLGSLISDAGDFPQAEALFRRVVALAPENHFAWNNLGFALSRQNRLSEARSALDRGLRLAPDSPVLLNNFANVLQRSGESKEAEQLYRRALASDPAYADAHANLGNLLRELRRFDEGLRHLKRAVELRPDHAEYYNNLGLLMQRAGQLLQAQQLYRRSIELKPGHAPAWNNLGGVSGNIGDHRQAVAAHARAEELRPGFHEAGSNRLFALHYARHDSPDKIAAAHREWAARYAARFYPTARVRPSAVAGRRLRVGYLSPDYRLHAVSYFIEPVLRHHHRDQFEIFAYSDVLVPDSRTAQLAQIPEHWVSVTGMTDEEIARRVAADGIDILVDLAGHTDRSRLLAFARAPAPVQITYLGYPDTTGVATIDYRITDSFADPASVPADWHVEKLCRLDPCAWCYQAPDDAPEVGSLPAATGQPFTFGCFNNFAKISEETISLWGEILRQCPETRLMLKAMALADREVAERVRGQFAAQGVARERLLLHRWERDAAGHFGRYREVDLALDTFPYHGTTTTCEALWMGVPVVSLVGDTHVSRVGLSLLQAVGCGDFATATPAGYVAKAVACTRDLDALAQLRASLRERVRRGPLGDAEAYVRRLEDCYRSVFAASCAKS